MDEFLPVFRLCMKMLAFAQLIHAAIEDEQLVVVFQVGPYFFGEPGLELLE